MKITTSAYNNVVKTLGSKKAEQGGIGMGKDGVITDFIHDKFAKTTGGTYSLNVPFLNPKIKEYRKQGKKLMMIIHSHPFGYGVLSSQDRKYFKSQFKNFEDLDKMYTPIVFSAKDGEFHFHTYAMYKDGTVKQEELEIVPDNYHYYLTKKVEVAKKEVVKEKQEQLKTEVIKTEKEVTINFHNEVTQKGELEPVVIYVEREKEVEEKQKLEKEEIEVIKNEETIDKTDIEIPVLKYVYHGLLIAFIVFVFLMILFLSPSIYNYIKTLLN